MNALKYKRCFSCISKFQKTKTEKRNKEVAVAISETIYNYIQNMSIHIHILFSFVKLLHSTASIGHN